MEDGSFEKLIVGIVVGFGLGFVCHGVLRNFDDSIVTVNTSGALQKYVEYRKQTYMLVSTDSNIYWCRNCQIKPDHQNRNDCCNCGNGNKNFNQSPPAECIDQNNFHQ